MNTKIEIKSIFGKVLFTYENENATITDAINQAVKKNANLSYANLRGANLSDAYLSGANLSYANLRGANLSDAYLSGANLSDANLSGANLSYANLRGANLSDANFSGANLSGANLSDANLSDANLRGANLSKRYIQISCIGSAKRMTTYCFDEDVIWCGCFKGSLQEFELKVNEAHKNNEMYLKEYLGAINYIKSLM